MPSSGLYSLSLHDALPISRARELARISPPRCSRTQGSRSSSARRACCGDRCSTASHTCSSCAPTILSRPVRSYSSPRSRPATKDRKSTRLNSSHLGISYAVLWAVLSFPTRRSSDLARAGAGEDLAAALLEDAGFTIVERQARVLWGPLLDGEPHLLELRADYLVETGAELLVAEVKTGDERSEEHTSELQSLRHLVCRPLGCTLFPYTTLFRSRARGSWRGSRRRAARGRRVHDRRAPGARAVGTAARRRATPARAARRLSCRDRCGATRRRGQDRRRKIGRAHV